ncbi:unnamed protein product [Lupinus luteus]|uniref:Uncharacterized protein n=1 Tax=Lupinus luteus TaxID=3873 RepID=A0AAV1Y842_LUPLU
MRMTARQTTRWQLVTSSLNGIKPGKARAIVFKGIPQLEKDRFPPRDKLGTSSVGSKLGVDDLGDSRLCSTEAEEKERSYSLKVRMKRKEKRKEQRRHGYHLAWESV